MKEKQTAKILLWSVWGFVFLILGNASDPPLAFVFLLLAMVLFSVGIARSLRKKGNDAGSAEE